MKKQPVLILGSSGHSKVIIDTFEKDGKHEIIGIIDNNRKIGDEILGYQIIGNDEHLVKLIAKNPSLKIFIAIGDNWLRQKVVKNILSNVSCIEFASAIHPSAQIGKNVSIGNGVAVMAGVVINSDSIIGDFTIINTNASVDHDARILGFSSLAPNVALGGNVTIGEYSAIGIGTNIIHGLTVGKHSVVGAGSLLMKSFENNLVIYGVPARIIRAREIGDRYL